MMLVCRIISADIISQFCNVPVDGKHYKKTIVQCFIDELAQGVIDYQIDENNLDYDAIREAINECIFWDDNCNDNDIVFPDLELWTDNNDNCNYCACFVVDWEEMETNKRL